MPDVLRGAASSTAFARTGSSSTKPSGPALTQLDSLCRLRIVDGHHYARFNPVCRTDNDLFTAVLSGAHLITGLRNRDIQQHLWATPAGDPLEARRRSRRVCRLLTKLRGHGLLGKVPGRRRYRVSLLGRSLMTAAVHYRQYEFPHVNGSRKSRIPDVLSTA